MSAAALVIDALSAAAMATASAIYQHTSAAALAPTVLSAEALITHNFPLMSAAALAPTVLSAAALISTQFSYTHPAPRLSSQTF